MEIRVRLNQRNPVAQLLPRLRFKARSRLLRRDIIRKIRLKRVLPFLPNGNRKRGPAIGQSPAGVPPDQVVLLAVRMGPAAVGDGPQTLPGLL